MADDAALVYRTFSWLGHAIGNGEAFFTAFSTTELGFEMPAAVLQAQPVVAAVEAARATAAASGAGAARLDRGLASGLKDDIVGGTLEITNGVGRFFQAVGPVADAVRAAITPATVPDAATRAAALAFAGTLDKRLGDHLIAAAFTDAMPVTALYLKVLGLIEWQRHFADPANPLAQDFVERRLRFHRIGNLITDPIGHLRESHRWGETAFNPEDIFALFAGFADDEDTIETGFEGTDAYLQTSQFRVKRDSGSSPPGLRFALRPGEAGPAVRSEINEQWGIGLTNDFKLSDTASAAVTPPFAVSISSPSGRFDGLMRLALDRNETARDFDILGDGGPLNLSANNVALGIAIDARGDGGGARLDPMLFLEISAATLRVGTKGADGFLNKLIESAQIEGSFDLTLELHPTDGLVVKASGGMEIALPIHKAIGVIEFDTVFLALRIKQQGQLELEVSTLIRGNLGPLTAIVERMGVAVDWETPEKPTGGYGPLTAHPRFQPPMGVGLVVDAGPVKGGGYLFLDYARGEYAGAMELVFSGFLNLKAVGIISTRMPDGSGYSLLIIITAEFGSGIQLGLGFTLLGVGGLIGLNRTMLLQPLAERIRSGAAANLLFPRDPVANAGRIISDIREIFPPLPDRFLIGPMAKLGWGTPTLVSLSLGVIIEIPGNIAILGVLKVALPTEDAPLIVLQVSFLGAIEFDKARLYFFATLFGSRILFITIDGDLAVLVAFGSDANLVVSVGGFHPAFKPPPLPFPVPQRLSITVLDVALARIRIEGYVALTPNTAQFGARAEAFFGFSEFRVEGDLAFDALIQFSPFHFIVSLSSRWGIKVFGVGVYGIGVRMSLEGPGRWRARGTGTLTLLFFDIDVHFDESWGSTTETPLPPVKVLALLREEIDKADSWRVLPPPQGQLLVSLRKLDATADGLVLHPVGVLRVTQKRIPLNLTISRVGTQKIEDAKRLSMIPVTGDLTKVGDPKERFAAAQFNDYKDAEKLSRPAFGLEDSGIDLAPQARTLFTGPAIKRIVRFELTTIDTHYRKFLHRLLRLSSLFLVRFFSGGSLAQSVLSAHFKAQSVPFADTIKAHPEGFSVVLASTNKPFGTATGFVSQQRAHDVMQNAVRANPGLRLHVVPSFEAAA